MEKTSFKSSLKVNPNSFENVLVNQSNKLKLNPKYINFTYKFILAVGTEIENNFSGVDFDFKVRTKSNSSTNKKIEKMTRLYNENIKEHLGMPDSHFKIYDTIGGKVVPFHVNDSFHSDYISIDGYITRRTKAYNILEKAISDLKNFKDNNSTIENFDLICAAKQETINAYREAYNLCEYICQNKVSEAIYSFVKENSYLKDEFGLYIADNRDKDFNTTEEYIAKHVTFGSSKMPDWFIELQFKSNIDYISARNGPSAHFNRNGKERLVPDNMEEINQDSIPSYVVYKSPTELYKAGNFENIYHYYQDQLTNEDLSKLINSSHGNNHGEYLKFSKNKLVSKENVLIK